jgi:hypothetical protein
LGALAPDVILATGTSTVGALLQATRTVPIVFATGERSAWRRLRREPRAAGRQRHRFHVFRVQHGREKAGAAQADRAKRNTGGGCHSGLGNSAVRVRCTEMKFGFSCARRRRADRFICASLPMMRRFAAAALTDRNTRLKPSDISGGKSCGHG